MSIAHSPHTSEPHERGNVSTVWMNLQIGCLCLHTEALPYAVSVHRQRGAQAMVSVQQSYLRFVHTQTYYSVRAMCVWDSCENLFQTICEVSTCFWLLEELGTSATAARSQVLSSELVCPMYSLTEQSDLFLGMAAWVSQSVHHFMQTIISQQLQDGLIWNFVPFMVPRQWIPMTWMIPLLFL